MQGAQYKVYRKMFSLQPESLLLQKDLKEEIPETLPITEPEPLETAPDEKEEEMMLLFDTDENLDDDEFPEDIFLDEEEPLDKAGSNQSEMEKPYDYEGDLDIFTEEEELEELPDDETIKQKKNKYNDKNNEPEPAALQQPPLPQPPYPPLYPQVQQIPGFVPVSSGTVDKEPTVPPVSETIPETTEQEEFLEEDPFGNTEEPENETGSMDTTPEKAPGTEGELEELSEEEDGDDLSFLEELPEDGDSQEEAEENEPEKTVEEDSETETDLDGGDSIFDELEEVLFEDEKGPDTDGEILNLQDDTPQDTDSTSGQDSLDENSSGNSDENFKPVEFHDDEDFTLNDDYLFDDSGISEDDLPGQVKACSFPGNPGVEIQPLCPEPGGKHRLQK